MAESLRFFGLLLQNCNGIAPIAVGRAGSAGAGAHFLADSFPSTATRIQRDAPLGSRSMGRNKLRVLDWREQHEEKSRMYLFSRRPGPTRDQIDFIRR
jgi:hypothetical protein